MSVLVHLASSSVVGLVGVEIWSALEWWWWRRSRRRRCCCLLHPIFLFSEEVNGPLRTTRVILSPKIPIISPTNTMADTDKQSQEQPKSTENKDKAANNSKEIIGE